MLTDPLGQLSLDVPLGWAYDEKSSHLGAVVFRRPERIHEQRVIGTDDARAPGDVLPIIEALARRGADDGDLIALRDAGLLASRARRSIERLTPRAADAAQLDRELGERIDALERMERVVLRDENAVGGMLPLSRGLHFLDRAAAAYERGRRTHARQFAEHAVDDMLSLQLRVLLKQDEELARGESPAHAQLANITDDVAEQGRIAKRVLNTYILADVTGALRTLTRIRHDLGDGAGALESTQLLLAIVRALDRPESVRRSDVLRSEGYRRLVCASMLDEIEHEIARDGSIDGSAFRWRLDDVEMMLDELKQGGLLRVRLRLLRDRIASCAPSLSADTIRALEEWSRRPRVVDRARDWRRAWAEEALRALDESRDLHDPGRLEGIERARAYLMLPPVLADYMRAQSAAERSTEASPLNCSPLPQYSPFGDLVVREVLAAIDAVVAEQEADPSRIDAVLSALHASPHREMSLAARVVDDAAPGSLFQATVRALAVGGAIEAVVYARHQRAEQENDTRMLSMLDRPLIRVAARYGTTMDYAIAMGRVALAQSRRTRQTGPTLVLEHLRIAAMWLGDAALEAVCEHGVALVLRDGARKGAGFIDAIAAFQRAATLRDQLGDSVSAARALIDLSAHLTAHHDVLQHVEEAREWRHFADRYLVEAMARLLAAEPSDLMLHYLGEAFQNRARLHLLNDDRARAADDARRSISFARATSNADLEERARDTLALAADDDTARTAQPAPLPILLADVRALVDTAMGTPKSVTKRGLFSTVLETLLDAAGTTIDERTAGGMLLAELESARGFTYNRWLGAARTFQVRRLTLEAASDMTRPVIAAYVIAERRAAIVVIDGNEPLRVLPIDMTAADIDRGVDGHLRGLVKQGRMRGEEPWDLFQREFASRAMPLVAPLEPYVATGRTLCLIPHRALHGAALHTLATTPGGEPIGLRTPVFTNPSLTNWLAARNASRGTSSRAFVGCVAPVDELSHFGEVGAVADALARAKIDVVRPQPRHVDLAALAAGAAEPWSVLHLSSHGMFEPETLEIGLLLARDGVLPPPPTRASHGIARHLARPADLRAAHVGARLAFLASCLSSRNENHAGDDLMGVTRAWFAGGTADLVGGAWTVLSSAVPPFARAFYAALVDGRSVAESMLAARRAVAASHPDPFYWGVFIHQGANGAPFSLKGTER